MKKSISIIALALLTAFVIVPFQGHASNIAMVKYHEEGISYSTLLAIADALDDMDHCTTEQALQWYKEGVMTITKIEAGVYYVVTPNGGVGALLIDAL